MLFRESFITDAGAELLARATLQAGKLIWTRAATSAKNTDGYNAEEMNALDEDHFGDITSAGAVTNAIVTDTKDSVAIYCELTNAEHDGEARTFGAWAKIEGDENEELVIVARCGGATPTFINPASQGVVKAFVDFSLSINATQAEALEVSETNYYATNAALQREHEAREALADRVVTMHAAGDEESGDSQTIRGEKSFVDDGYFKSLQPLHLYRIDINWIDNSIDEATFIENLGNILNIDSTEAKELYEAIVNTDFMENYYSIKVPSYNITESNIDAIVSELNEAGFSCSKYTTTSSIGSNETPFDYAFLSTVAAQTGDFTNLNVDNDITLEKGISSTIIKSGSIKVNNSTLPSVYDIAGYQPATEPGEQPTFNDAVGAIRLFSIYASGNSQPVGAVSPGELINTTYAYYLKHSGTNWERTSERPTGIWRALTSCAPIYGPLEGMVLAIRTG